MDESRVMVAFAVLIIACFLCFSAGYLVGATNHEPPQRELLPANWNPAQAAQTDAMKLCMQTLADNAANCRKPEQVAH